MIIGKCLYEHQAIRWKTLSHYYPPPIFTPYCLRTVYIVQEAEEVGLVNGHWSQPGLAVSLNEGVLVQQKSVCHHMDSGSGLHTAAL